MSDSYEQKRRGKAMFLLLVLLVATVPVGLAYMLNLPETGSDTYKKSGVVIDMSNSNQGYILVKRESKKRQKLRVEKGKIQYDYDINGNGEYEIIPLQMGSGTYKVSFYEQKSGNQYAAKFRDKSIKVKLDDDNINFLYPNQYVRYDENTKAVALANEMCAGLEGDLEKYKAIADYIKATVVYDYLKAMDIVGNKVTSYLPDQDETLETKMGICFDFAALSATMLRSQGIATKLVIGYADTTYHAWNEVLIDGQWGRSDLTFAVTNTKISSDKYTEERIY